MIKLPRKPSRLIRLALRDLALIEKSCKYEVCMSTWHTGTLNKGTGTCYVCLAGAVLAKTLKYPHENYAHVSSDVGLENRDQLLSLNMFRSGLVDIGLDYLDQPRSKWGRKNVNIPSYEDDPKMFRASLTQLAKDLAEKGL